MPNVTINFHDQAALELCAWTWKLPDIEVSR